MKKHIVSNRVFWAGVVLASAALIGHSGGDAQPPQANAPSEVEFQSVKTRLVTILDAEGKPAILIGASKAHGPLIQIGMDASPASMSLAANPKYGPNIIFTKNSKPLRFISPDGKRDVPFRPGNQ